MRFIGYLLLLALVGYGLWPYYGLYQLDAAVSAEDTGRLANVVDLAAIKRNYKKRIAAGVKGVMPTDDPHGITSWVRQNVERLGESALDQVITLQWVRNTLRDAITQASGQKSPYLFGAVDFAFFESYNRFLVRLGELGEGETHIRLTLIDKQWKVTDIIP